MNLAAGYFASEKNETDLGAVAMRNYYSITGFDHVCDVRHGFSGSIILVGYCLMVFVKNQ
jgi:hypothetical protein